MPETRAAWIERGFPPEFYRPLRVYARTELCQLSGRCHGEKQHCIHCGPVDKTCHDQKCDIHARAQRCGQIIPTSLGYRICAQEPGHNVGCFALQPEWFTYRKALRDEQ